MAGAACGRQGAYDTCGESLPCSSSAPLCLSDTTASGHTALFCTERCTTASASSSACPDNGACVNLNGQGFVCLDVCTTTADCAFTGAVCTTLPESSGARVCAAQP